MDKDISIIIPCYNHGEFLLGAIESAKSCKGLACEIIVVDDGSNELSTQIALANLEHEDLLVIRKTNGGVGSARNLGISKSSGRYLLPLDADNRIRPEFVMAASRIMDQDPKVGVVHGNYKCFGVESGVREVPKFSIREMLLGNYIDACAVFRREVWDECGGYDEKMPVQGHEDWDLWLTAYENGWEFHHFDGVAFEYQIRPDSMLANLRKDSNWEKNETYIHKKHAQLLMDEYKRYYSWEHQVDEFRKRPLRSILRLISRAYFPKIHKRYIGSI